MSPWVNRPALRLKGARSTATPPASRVALNPAQNPGCVSAYFPSFWNEIAPTMSTGPTDSVNLSPNAE